MKRLNIFLISFVLFFVLAQTALAAYGQVFGGRILKTKAIRIETLESAGYSCPGSTNTIEVTPIKGPTAYYAPYSANRTRTTLAPGQKILGKYSGSITIECVRVNEDGTTSQEDVLLDMVTMFGTSKR
jgi:hypothetical protein